eukprot:4045106-Lingulodinium_polyedra.AAC.1
MQSPHRHHHPCQCLIVGLAHLITTNMRLPAAFQLKGSRRIRVQALPHTPLWVWPHSCAQFAANAIQPRPRASAWKIP